MKELTAKQELAIVNGLICVQMAFIGLLISQHIYTTLWMWGVWLLGTTVVKYAVCEKKIERCNNELRERS